MPKGTGRVCHENLRKILEGDCARSAIDAVDALNACSGTTSGTMELESRSMLALSSSGSVHRKMDSKVVSRFN